VLGLGLVIFTTKVTFGVLLRANMCQFANAAE
jgi:hypothetical protein